jgi:hypothetical protein
MEGCEHIGCGWEMATYFASRTYLPGISLEIAQRLAAYIIWEVKHHVPSCGGDSIIYQLTNGGHLQYRGWGDIRDLERHFLDVEKRIGSLRLNTANLEMTDEAFDHSLRSFAHDMRLSRRARRAADIIEKQIGGFLPTPSAPGKRKKR